MLFCLSQMVDVWNVGVANGLFCFPSVVSVWEHNHCLWNTGADSVWNVHDLYLGDMQYLTWWHLYLPGDLFVFWAGNTLRNLQLFLLCHLRHDMQHLWQLHTLLLFHMYSGKGLLISELEKRSVLKHRNGAMGFLGWTSGTQNKWPRSPDKSRGRFRVFLSYACLAQDMWITDVPQRRPHLHLQEWRAAFHGGNLEGFPGQLLCYVRYFQLYFVFILF